MLEAIACIENTIIAGLHHLPCCCLQTTQLRFCEAGRSQKHKGKMLLKQWACLPAV